MRNDIKPKKRNSRRNTARVKNKQTRNHQRLQRARDNLVQAAVVSLVLGMVQKTTDYLALDQARHVKQLQRVERWGWQVLQKIEIGRTAMLRACELVEALQQVVDRYISPVGHKTVGHYAAVWIALGYLCDEASLIYHRHSDPPWNWLASTVNNWSAMVLEHAEADRDYELLAGEMAEKIREVVLNG